MLCDKNKKRNEIDNTMSFILTKILGHKGENAYDVRAHANKNMGKNDLPMGARKMEVGIGDT